MNSHTLHILNHLNEHQPDADSAGEIMVDALNRLLDPTSPSCPVEKQAISALRISIATRVLLLCCSNDMHLASASCLAGGMLLTFHRDENEENNEDC